MKVIALAQMKGGSSKSCTAINLACQAAAHGFKAALVDLDVEQGTAMKWGERREALEPFVAGSDIHKFEAMMQNLGAAGYDWVFLDLPGRRATIASMGIAAADLVLIPCRPVDTDIEPSFNTVQTAMRMGKSYFYVIGIAPPQVDKQRARKISEVLIAAGHPVAPVIVVQRLAVPDAVALGKGVNEFEPNGEAAKEFAALFEWLKGEIDVQRKQDAAGARRRRSKV